jgi:hypothetical protein
VFSALRSRLLGISTEEASFVKRGFPEPDPKMQPGLERVLKTFIEGYNLTLEIRDYDRLCEKLEREFDNHYVGFAFEGVGMCLCLLDLVTPGRGDRLRAFTDGPGRKHDYITTVGAGFAIIRLPWGLRKLNGYLRTLDPWVAWCVPDGIGFHQGFFRHRRFIDGAAEPPGVLPVWARQLFDSGVGRSMWWAKSASPRRIKDAIDRFPEPRRAELWCGIGVAASYAGGLQPQEQMQLVELSGEYRAHLMCGVPFSARMRQKGGNQSEVTDGVCGSLIGMTTGQAADLIVQFLAELDAELARTGIEWGYMLVRQRLLKFFKQRMHDASFEIGAERNFHGGAASSVGSSI